MNHVHKLFETYGLEASKDVIQDFYINGMTIDALAEYTGFSKEGIESLIDSKTEMLKKQVQIAGVVKFIVH